MVLSKPLVPEKDKLAMERRIFPSEVRLGYPHTKLLRRPVLTHDRPENE